MVEGFRLLVKPKPVTIAPFPAPLAQLDRALPSEGRGQTFESSGVHHGKTIPLKGWFLRGGDLLSVKALLLGGNAILDSSYEPRCSHSLRRSARVSMVYKATNEMALFFVYLYVPPSFFGTLLYTA